MLVWEVSVLKKLFLFMGVLVFVQINPAFGQDAPKEIPNELQRTVQPIFINGQEVQGVIVTQNGAVQRYTCPSPEYYTTPNYSATGWACLEPTTGMYLLNAQPAQSTATTYSSQATTYPASQIYTTPSVPSYNYPVYGYPDYYPYGYPSNYYPYYPYSYPYYSYGYPYYGYGLGFGVGFNNFNGFRNGGFRHGHAGSGGNRFMGGGHRGGSFAGRGGGGGARGVSMGGGGARMGGGGARMGGGGGGGRMGGGGGGRGGGGGGRR
jgi:hypothetical protein